MGDVLNIDSRRQQGTGTAARVFVDEVGQAVHVWTCETFGLSIAIESTEDGHYQLAGITPENRDRLILALGGEVSAQSKEPA